MSDIVAVGAHRLPGEVVAISGDRATVQAYEYTGGLAPGHPAAGLGVPLSARLGPHLLGGVFDGLLRPLEHAGPWLDPARQDARQAGQGPAGAGRPGTAQVFAFSPQASDRDAVSAGACLGTVATAGGVAYRVLVPPQAGGAVAGLAGAGQVDADEVIATVGGQPVRLTSTWPVRLPRPYAERLEGGAPLQTGQRVVDVLFPVTRGGTSAVPGGFGTGKTVLLQQITKWSDADVIVYVGCGERGNELADMLTELAGLEDPRTGGRLAQRTVVIANTSNMPMMAREASIYSAAAVAEFFRDMGLHVVVVADSTSRWAEALREFSSRNGEMPAEEGYPASLSSALAAFYERAGRVITGGGLEGSITIIGAVSPAGGDMTEPVTAYTQRFVRSLWTLDRDLAYARHYPAISWAGSFSRDAGPIGNWHARNGDPGWADRRARLSGLLAEADRIGELAELMGVTALPPRQRMAILAGRLAREGVLQQSAVSGADAYCDRARAAALVDAVLAVGDRCRELAEGGADAGLIEEQDFSPVLRAKEDAATPEQVRALAKTMLARLGALAGGVAR
jgi:V/A-type H+-transporting ATPase subunit A